MTVSRKTLSTFGFGLYADNYLTYFQRNASHAIRKDDRRAVEYLLSRGVSPLSFNTCGMNAVHYAVECRSLPVLRLLFGGKWDDETGNKLLPAGSWLESAWKALDVGTKDEGLLPLHIAAMNGSTKIVNYIIDVVGKRKSAKNFLLSLEDMLEYKAKYAMTPLLLSAQFNKAKTFKCLAAKGASIHAKSIRMQNVLHLAAINNNKAMVDYLMEVDLEEGKLRRHRDYRGKTPIQYAKKDEIKFALLSIWDAVETGNLMDIQTLVNISDGKILEAKHPKDEGRPLHYAIKLGKLPVVRLLVECKAAKDVTDAEGKLPADVAMEIADPGLRQEMLSALSYKSNDNVLLKSLTQMRDRRPTRSAVELMKEVLGLTEQDVLSSIKPSAEF